MVPETRICQNCKTTFVIEPEDFQFYAKIVVPPPTFCPDCRFQRRLAFFNATNLYRRKCDLCHKESISTFHPDAPYTVYCPKCWWSDAWSPLDYGRNYDFSRPFFEQLNELWHSVPIIGISTDPDSTASSPYTHDVGHMKNSYLIFHGESCEDNAYGFYNYKNRSTFDCTAVVESERCYDGMHSYRTNHCIGARDQLANSIDCIFCRDCLNCQNCFGCANLKNKKYHIFNKPYTKEAYFEELKKYDLGSYKGYVAAQRAAEEFWKTQPLKSEYNEFIENCTGPNIFFSKNVKDSIEVQHAEDSRWLFLVWGLPTKDSYDISTWGNNVTWSYEGCVVGENATRMLFCQDAGLDFSNAEYAKISVSAADHFGCVSVRKTKHCILNKQYSKEEYEALRERIIQHMNDMPYTDAHGNVYRYGEFFPPEMSPFAYNETLAQNFFPLTKAEAERKKYPWRVIERAEQAATLTAEDLPDHIKDAPDNIVNETIKCPTCPRAYRIIQMELDFLRQMNVPLPRRCPMCRIEEKLNIWVKDQERNRRSCSVCGAEFESKYREPEAPMVLCRKCYNREVA
ncbi:MAG: hypothetical protein AAB759_01820 [Patescibacteria group bacterium]